MLSRPLQVEWAGWRTDTYKLQGAGWSLSAHQDYAENRMRLAMEHKALQMRAISHHIDFRFMDAFHEGYRHEEYLRSIVIPMHVVGREITIHESGSIDWNAFQPIDATPQFVQHRINRIQDVVHFAPAQVRTKELIVPQENVEELMTRILDLQNPARLDRIREEVKSQGTTIGGVEQALGKQKFEAQIISIAA